MSAEQPSFDERWRALENESVVGVKVSLASFVTFVAAYFLPEAYKDVAVTTQLVAGMAGMSAIINGVCLFRKQHAIARESRQSNHEPQPRI